MSDPIRSRIPPIPRMAGVLLPDRDGAVRELLAGVTLVALCLPLNIGYAEAAGLPAVVGINATILPLIVFAVLAGSRHLVTGPDASVAALLAATIPGVAAASGAGAEEICLAVAMLTGVVLLAFWLLRLGSLVRFLSKAVLAGFLAGLAIEILTSQVKKIMNVHVEAEQWGREVIEIVKAIPDASGASVLAGLSTIAIVRLCKRFVPAVPGALVALVAVSGAVAIFDPSGMQLLGEVPSGLPSATFPTLSWQTWSSLVGVGVAIAVLTVAEGLAVAGASARHHDEAFDGNAELFALGASNVAAAVSAGMPIGASASRSAALEGAGSRTQFPSIVAAVLTATIALFFMDLVAHIPSAVLGGLVANAVVSIIEVDEFRRFAAVRRTELAIAVGCAAGVLVFGAIPGLVLATLATAIDAVRRASAHPWVVLASGPGDPTIDRFAAADDAGMEVPEGLTILRAPGALFYANADELRNVLLTAAHDPSSRWIVLDLEAVSDIDPTASDSIEEGAHAAAAAGKVVAVTRASSAIRSLIDRYGLNELIEPARQYTTNRAAAEAYLGDR